MLSVLVTAGCSDDSGTDPDPVSTVASLDVSAPDGTLERTLTTQAVAVARDASSAVIANPSLTWSSSDIDVATVSNTGLITATGRGTARITATSGSISDFVDFDVFVRYSAISAGANFACDVGSIGLVHCWGQNNRGQHAVGGTSNATTPVTATGSVRLAKLAAGGGTVCGLTATGAAYCSGANASGQLGIGGGADRNTFSAVLGGLTFASITVGDVHVCGLTAAGAAYCWGDNFDGQLGNGTTNNASQPTAVLGGLTFASIRAGYQGTCGVTTDNRGFCWGQDAAGQIGDGGVITNNTTDKKTQPTQVQGGAIWSAITPGGNTTCGITTAGTARCWGAAGTGMLGNGTNVSISSPGDDVSGGRMFRAIFVSQFIWACGLTTTNEAYCWGANSDGQLGSAAPTDLSTTPIRAGGALTFSDLSISQSGSHACGITVDLMTTYCWGLNTNGQLGNGATSVTRNPTPGIVVGQTPQ